MSEFIFVLIFVVGIIIITWPYVKLLNMMMSPRAVCRAKLISKHSLSTRHYSNFQHIFNPYLKRSSRCGILSGSSGFGRFFGTFQTERDGQIELQMYLERFKELNEGDEVEIVYKKNWLVTFNKLTDEPLNND